jgi:hypothetical protein
MKIWSSKHALTTGPTEHEARLVDNSMVAIKDGLWPKYLHGEGREWHRTFEEAAARAEVMKARKIANLRKQIARLESIQFSPRSEEEGGKR